MNETIFPAGMFNCALAWVVTAPNVIRSFGVWVVSAEPTSVLLMASVRAKLAPALVSVKMVATGAALVVTLLFHLSEFA
jgi:hypothetical protein